MLNDKLSKLRFMGLFLTLFLVLISTGTMLVRGLNLGIDFTGGFITEFSTSQSIEPSKMEQALQAHIVGKFELTSAEDSTNWTVRQPELLSDGTKNDLLTSNAWLKNLQESVLVEKSNITIIPLDSDYIGTQIGQELIEQGGLAMLTALIMILVYLSMRFEWRFALGSVLALFHDIVVVIGIFAWTQLEFNLTVLASMLAIIGYSLNDSIIVADRIRESMKLNQGESLSHVINAAIRSTLTRTLITSGTTLATIGSLWWLAGAPLEGFSVALFFGIFVGTLSSICISATFPELTGLKVDYYQIKEQEARELQESI
ncbi:protein translocase subunit SecF [Aliikangiella marina]|uniref:Protein-export membrane protein SecF n=1 Tax=Aliikangiella marina TaxID=1712262 RepID=A0A545T6R7_9GAMM|nr:protein translocase subunit SecF [Aliikangiella marina]TQV72913.1 protein translocase subunit SecF [Aliikangiella marina]